MARILSQSRGEHSFGGGWALEALANAYYGLVPWNSFFADEQYLDHLLMPNVDAPQSVLRLSPEELLKYKAQVNLSAKPSLRIRGDLREKRRRRLNNEDATEQ